MGEKKKIDNETMKNLCILITGSVLIITAIIAFLVTAWDDIPNIIKLIVLISFEFLFIGLSNLTDKKLKLENVSKALFYIAMTYIPICFIAVSILELLGEYLSISGDGKYIFFSISAIIMAITYYYESTKRKDKYILYASVVSQIIAVIFTTLIFSQNALLVYISLLIYNLIIIFTTKNNVFKHITIILPIALTLGVLNQLNDNSGSFILCCMLLSANYLTLELRKSNEWISILFNMSLYLFAFSLIFKKIWTITGYSNCQIIAILFIIGIVIINETLKKQLKDNKSLIDVSRISTIVAMSFLYLDAMYVKDGLGLPLYFISIIIEALIIFNFLETKNMVYKYLGYAFINVVFMNVYLNFKNDLEFLKVIPMITTSAILAIEIFNNKHDNKNFEIFLAVIEAFSFICLSLYNTIWIVLLAMAFAILIIIYNEKIHNQANYNLIPLIGLLPCIVNKNLDLNLRILITSSLAIISTVISIIREKEYAYKIVSLFYIGFLASLLKNEYFIVIIFIVWSTLQMLMTKDKKWRDIFQACLVITITVLYYLIVRDLSLMNNTLLKLLGVSIAGMYLIKQISKYYDNFDNVSEYVFWSLIYLFAISDYKTVDNGVIFGIFIIFMIFFSYYKKYGPTFLVSIIALIVNAIYLTREFWETVPWWIYLFLVGGIFVVFAIINEANKKNSNQITFKSIVEKYKTTFKVKDSNK